MKSNIFRVALALVTLCPFAVHAQTLADLSTEFNDASSLAGWQWHHDVEGWPSKMDSFDVNLTTPGALHLVPTSSGWFNDMQAAYLFREISGDFVAEMRVRATGKNSITPTSLYSLSGLMARVPRDITPETWVASNENWLFLTTGTGNNGNQQFENKTTVNGSSTLVLSAADTGWVHIRMAREANTFTLDYSYDGESWTNNTVFIRNDFPDSIQVGMIAYADWESISQYANNAFPYNNMVVNEAPDLISRVDYIRFTGNVKTGLAPEIPESYDGVEVWPNPFTSHLNIQSAGGQITVDIYDILGRRVKSFSENTKILTWNGKAENGNQLPAGVYFIRAKINLKILTKRVVLLK